METAQYQSRHEVGRYLEVRQRNMYFSLGAEIQNYKTVTLRYSVDADYCANLALWALSATDWKSLKAARAILTATRRW